MSTELSSYKVMTLNDAGFDELWLQDEICKNPSSLGLGDLILVAREKIISSGGRLDILLQNEEDDMYEVEVQLGDTDPSHIIRTIEYWDLIRKKYPQRQHFAVIVAEGITKRFFNVISLLSTNIPIIAVQCQIVEIDGKKALVFTKVLDVYEEPEEVSIEQSAEITKKYWEQKAPNVLSLVELLLNRTKDIYKGSMPAYNNSSVVIKLKGYNMIKLFPKSGNFVFIEMKHGNNRDKMLALLNQEGIPTVEKYEQVRFTISIDELKEKLDMIIKLAEMNVDWWKSSGA